MINATEITAQRVDEIEARVRETICETHSFGSRRERLVQNDDGEWIDGPPKHSVSVEGRISASDFEALLSAARVGVSVRH